MPVAHVRKCALISERPSEKKNTLSTVGRTAFRGIGGKDAHILNLALDGDEWSAARLWQIYPERISPQD
jgi:hypothetical protein